MTDELKPCPFCGSNSIRTRHGGDWEGFEGIFGNCYWIECGECRANGPVTKIGPKTLREESIKAWNKRIDSIQSR